MSDGYTWDRWSDLKGLLLPPFLNTASGEGEGLETRLIHYAVHVSQTIAIIQVLTCLTG